MDSEKRAQTGIGSVLAGRTVTGPVSARLTIDGRQYINFYGSRYLALSLVPEIRQAVRQALEQGAPFAQQVSAALGHVDPFFRAVEDAGAAACTTEASVYFASGYLIGAIGMASLERSCDLVVLDEHAHYNLQDAAKLSGLPAHRFSHCDVDSLSDLLKDRVHANTRPLLMTDGVFATSGRVAPLADYAEVLAAYEGQLFVDESHGFGVVGENGRGAAEYCGVETQAALGTTLSKAFCTQGAIVGCSATTARRLRMTPQVRGSSAGSPLSAVAAAASLAYVSRHPELRQTVRRMTDYLRMRLRAIGVGVIDSPAPIVSFQWGQQADMVALQRRAFDRGIYIHYSTYIGAGPEGTIRCAVFRDHSEEDIDALIAAMG